MEQGYIFGWMCCSKVMPEIQIQTGSQASSHQRTQQFLQLLCSSSLPLPVRYLLIVGLAAVVLVETTSKNVQDVSMSFGGLHLIRAYTPSLF